MTLAVYRGFDQAQLDAQYSPSSKVEDIQPFLDDYTERSRRARDELGSLARLDFSYGSGPDDKVDVYGPAGEGPEARPAVFFIHGGYWQQLSKDDTAFPAPALVEAGAVYATPDYTLAPHARLGQIVDQTRAAYAWLWRNAADLRIDPERIVISGSSAGAHLAAMLLSTDWSRWGLSSTPIAGAVLFSGIYDLTPIQRTYVNEVVRFDDDEVPANSPMFLPAARCPVVVAWGEHETDEFKRQSLAYTAWRHSHGRPVTAFEQPGRNHFDSPMELADPGTRVHAETRRLLGLPPT